MVLILPELTVSLLVRDMKITLLWCLQSQGRDVLLRSNPGHFESDRYFKPIQQEVS